MAATGRPRFEPTEKQRGQVEAMARYGIPETEIARTIGVSKPTLLKYFRDELDTGATKANAQVGEFIFSTILGVPIPGRPPVTDGRARATLAIFWAKTRMLERDECSRTQRQAWRSDRGVYCPRTYHSPARSPCCRKHNKRRS